MKCVTQIWFHKCKCCRLDYTLELGKRASAKSLELQFDTFIPWMGYLMPQSLDYQSTFSFGANTYKIYMKWSIVTLFTNCHQFQKRNSMTYANKTLSYLSRCLGWINSSIKRHKFCVHTKHRPFFIFILLSIQLSIVHVKC